MHHRAHQGESMGLHLGKILRRQLIGLKFRKISDSYIIKELAEAKLNGAFKEYNILMNEARSKLNRSVSHLSRPTDSQTHALQLIYFSAIGSKMVKHVPEWIHAMGKACLRVGDFKLGNELIAHSKQEDGHYLWYLDDLRGLCRYTKRHFGLNLDPGKIVRTLNAQCPIEYAHLHETSIASPFPFAWFAIQYEIERLSLMEGPRFIGKCVEDLGFEILKSLSFAAKHVQADQQHAVENIQLMSKLIAQHPNDIEHFVDVGAKALKIYQNYFEEADYMARQFAPQTLTLRAA